MDALAHPQSPSKKMPSKAREHFIVKSYRVSHTKEHRQSVRHAFERSLDDPTFDSSMYQQDGLWLKYDWLVNNFFPISPIDKDTEWQSLDALVARSFTGSILVEPTHEDECKEEWEMLERIYIWAIQNRFIKWLVRMVMVNMYRDVVECNRVMGIAMNICKYMKCFHSEKTSVVAKILEIVADTFKDMRPQMHELDKIQPYLDITNTIINTIPSIQDDIVAFLLEYKKNNNIANLIKKHYCQELKDIMRDLAYV